MLKKIIVGMVLMANVALGCENHLVHDLGQSLFDEGTVRAKGDTLYIDEEKIAQITLKASIKEGISKEDMDQILATALQIYLDNHYPEVKNFESE